MQPNWLSVWKSGVVAGSEKSVGVGRSTRRPRPFSIAAKLSSSSLARSIVSCGRRPHWPRMSLSSGTLASNAGSAGGMWQLSARPTMTWRSVSHSFQLLTSVFSADQVMTRCPIFDLRPRNRIGRGKASGKFSPQEKFCPRLSAGAEIIDDNIDQAWRTSLMMNSRITAPMVA